MRSANENAGSVGAPYEAEPAAYWALLGPKVEHRRTDYDLESAIAAIAATGYPKAGEAESYLRPDAERPARISALIEGVPPARHENQTRHPYGEADQIRPIA